MQITPTIAIASLISYSVSEFLVQNYPYAFEKDLLKPCEKNWWSTLLHIQNQVNPEEMVRKLYKNSIELIKYGDSFQCLPWTWFLSVDWQMYLLAPILIYPALKVGKQFLVASLAVFLTFSAWTAYTVSLENNFLVHKTPL